MTKNITVLDAWGRRCGSTWPRRAAGLVHKGRACYVGPNAIRLARPTQKEDAAVEEMERMQQEMQSFEIEQPEFAPEMEAQTEQQAVAEPEAQEPPAPPAHPEPPRPAPPVPPQYVMDTIDRVLSDNGHLSAALMTIEKMPTNCPEDGRAAAIAAIVQARETTHQKLLGLLEKMYDDLK